MGEGIVLEGEKLISSCIIIMSGYDFVNVKEMVVIFGEGLVRNLGVKVGDMVVILVIVVNGSLNVVEVMVVGMFVIILKDFDDNVFCMLMEVVWRLMCVGGVIFWVVFLD